uniref:Uncharacterized protein n=1 Tax=Arundo donax TaxID=35708 RepID=A0A0A9AAK8_ARUDO
MNHMTVLNGLILCHGCFKCLALLYRLPCKFPSTSGYVHAPVP